MITGIYVYGTVALELATAEADLALEPIAGGDKIALRAAITLAPGAYRVSSRAPLGLRPASATAVDIVEADTDAALVAPPRARAVLGLDAARAASARRKRALVVGAQTLGLRGTENDARAMAALLAGRGFSVDLRLGNAATRAGILAGYDQLIAQSSDGDAAVFYYSGHGAYTVLGDDQQGSAQHIVPFDYEHSEPDDWRGITAWELSIKQHALTDKTRNAVVILDCCHSSQMSRDAAARAAIPRALPHPNVVGFAGHLAALDAAYPGARGTLDPAGNPHAVRVVACDQTELAHEYPDADGEYHGAFTEALLAVMAQIGAAPITWIALGDAIRARVLPVFPTQRPDVEGPSRRRLFELIEDDERGAVGIQVVDDKHVVLAGRIAQVAPGDVYGVMPVGAAVYDAATALGRVEIVDVFALTSIARRLDAGAAFPIDAVAIPIARAAPRRSIALDAPAASAADRELIAAAVEATGTLRLARPDEPGAVATLRLADRTLTILDALGPMFQPAAFPAALQPTVKNLANLGVAARVRDLEGEAGVLASEVAIELGVYDGGHRALPDRGAALGLRDRVSIRMTNLGERTLYFHVFNIGLRGRVALLSKFDAGGIELHPGASYTLGAPNARLPPGPSNPAGLGLMWPEGMIADTPRLDEVFAIVTTAPASLASLETTEGMTRGAARGGSKLDDLLAQVQDGATRDMTGPQPIDGYFAKRLSFVLHPRPIAIGGLVFQVDENRTAMAGAREPAAWGSRSASPLPADVPSQIAIRLGDLVVLDNLAWLRTDIRVDAVVCTRTEGDAAAFKPITWTAKYQRIDDGERLALDNAVIYHGPVVDFVDIALFVSRDTKGSRDLAEMFAAEANGAEFRDAASALLVAAGAAAGSPWVAAVGASATLIRIAHKLVLGLRGDAIGLYRTSFLARERFGVGRLPAEGLYRAKDFEFSLTIEPV